MLTDHIKKEIKKHALENPNEEVCGFILENKILRARNIAYNKRNNFSIHPEDYIIAEESGKILAIYHSHPSKNNNFTEFDKVNAQNHNKIYILYCVKTDSFHEFYPYNYINKYIGMEFSYKNNNCFTLIKNFYKDQFNIEIITNNEINNLDKNWYENHPTLFRDMLTINNNFFNLLNINQIQKYDVILFNYLDINKPPHHLGIYMDNDIFLHHPRHGFSKFEMFDHQYKSKVTNILRHNEIVRYQFYNLL